MKPTIHVSTSRFPVLGVQQVRYFLVARFPNGALQMDVATLDNYADAQAMIDMVHNVSGWVELDDSQRVALFAQVGDQVRIRGYDSCWDGFIGEVTDILCTGMRLVRFHRGGQTFTAGFCPVFLEIIDSVVKEQAA